MGDSPLQPSPHAVPWIYTQQPSGRSLATFLGDVDIDGTVTAPGLSAGSLVGQFNPLAYGADPTGVADSGPAMLAACAAAAAVGGTVLVTPGNYAILSNTAINCSVQRQAGATFTLGTGITLTFNAAFVNPFPSSTFINATAGQGSVVFVNSPTVAWPEWWGAQINNSAIDCAPAINAAIKCGLLFIQLRNQDYWIKSQVQVTTPFVNFYGAGCNYQGSPGQATRIVNDIATPTPGVLVGAVTEPAGGPNNFPLGIIVHDIYTASAGYSVAASPGNEWTQGTVGFAFQYCANPQFWNLKTAEFGIGFLMVGNVYALVANCAAFRSFPSATPYTGSINGSIAGYTLTVNSTTVTLARGTALGAPAVAGTVIIGQTGGTAGGAGTYLVSRTQTVATGAIPTSYDPFWGFACNGNVSIGLAGGNASLYLHRNTVSMGGTPVPFSLGLYLPGAFQDIFVRDFETSELAAGIIASGITGNTNGNYDLQIEHMVLDQCVIMGLLIENCEPCSIDIAGGYIAVSSSTAYYGAAFNNVNGACNFSRVEILGSPTQGNLSASASFGLTSSRNRLIEGQYPCFLTACGDSSFEDVIQNLRTTTPNAAVTVNGGANAQALYVRPIIRGGTAGGTFGHGISILNGAVINSEFNCTGLDSAILPANSKLNNNGTAVTAPGLFGSNLASGVMT